MVYSTRRFVLCFTLCYFVLVFFSPFKIAITSLGEERANLSAFRTFVWYALVWFCLFPFPLGVFEGLRCIANSSSCTTTVLSKLLTSCLTAVKEHWIRYYDAVYERNGIAFFFGQLKIPMMFSINLNLKTSRLLNCLHMIFLLCILRYLIIL